MADREGVTHNNQEMNGYRIFIRLLLALVFGLCLYYFFPEAALKEGTKIDQLVVYKSKHELVIFSKGEKVKTYSISLGKEPIGAKEFEGDNKTPEGTYQISSKNLHSAYHKNLGISYPNEADKSQARKHEKLAGGDIKIHGLPNGVGFIYKFHRWYDWTQGCIAITNVEMDELFDAVDVGTPIEIKP